MTKYQIEQVLIANNVQLRGKSESQLGRKFSNEHRLKLSQKHTGKVLSDDHKKRLCGRTPWNKGNGTVTIKCANCKKEVLSKKYRLQRYCSNKCKTTATGEAHWNYTGLGLRGPQTKRNWKIYKDFKKAVHSRDTRCLCCGKSSPLDAHHLQSWKDNEDLRFDISNAISLCRKCHRDLHSYCGQKKINQQKHDEWLYNNKIMIAA